MREKSHDSDWEWGNEERKEEKKSEKNESRDDIALRRKNSKQSYDKKEDGCHF